ncbi:tetratricopeptide repeat protein, partial [bacterium]|nr:tetratricopeptide repeat protein [bacterium]
MNSETNHNHHKSESNPSESLPTDEINRHNEDPIIFHFSGHGAASDLAFDKNKVEDITSFLSNLGSLYQINGNYPEAIKYNMVILDACHVVQNKDVEADALANLGAIYESMGDYQKAIEHFQESLSLAREIGDWQAEGNALGNLGVTYQSLGQYERAIDYFQQHLMIAQEVGDRRSVGNALGNLGVTYQSLG